MPAAFTLHESSPQPPKHSLFPGCDAPIRQAPRRTHCPSAAGNGSEAHHARPGLTTVPMGEVILWLPDDGAQENLLPVAGRVFVVVRPGIQTNCSRSTLNPRCAARRRDGGVTDIESRLSGHPIAYRCARCAYNPKLPEASRPTGAAGSAIPSPVGAVACASGHAVPSPDGRPCGATTGL